LKPCILFVDDEEKVLHGLRRTLYDKRDHWQIEFALGGEAALDVLKNFPCDVLVTDMQMPGMNGSELMDRVREMHPEIIRIVLSGNYDQSSVFRLVHGEHQYLRKPCDKDLLVNTIDASLKLRDVNEGGALHSQVEELSQALEKLSGSLFNKGIVSVVEVSENIQQKIIEKGLDPLAPIVADEYDPLVEDELDALYSLKAENEED